MALPQVCACPTCAAYEPPRRAPISGIHGEPVAWRGCWWHRMRAGHYRHGGKCARHPRGVLLHRWAWETHRGPIPPGHNVHHRNEDPGDNRIENLEALSVRDHLAAHAPRGYLNLTPADRAANVTAMWSQRQPRAVDCSVCGRGILTVGMRTAFCSYRCAKVARGTDVSGWTVQRVCEWCNEPFLAATVRARFCSHRCRQAQTRAVWDAPTTVEWKAGVVCKVSTVSRTASL